MNQIMTPYGAVELSRMSEMFLDSAAPMWRCLSLASMFDITKPHGLILEKLVKDVTNLAEMHYNTGRSLKVF